jgi:hypothetical protein
MVSINIVLARAAHPSRNTSWLEDSRHRAVKEFKYGYLLTYS